MRIDLTKYLSEVDWLVRHKHAGFGDRLVEVDGTEWTVSKGMASLGAEPNTTEIIAYKYIDGMRVDRHFKGTEKVYYIKSYNRGTALEMRVDDGTPLPELLLLLGQLNVDLNKVTLYARSDGPCCHDMSMEITASWEAEVDEHDGSGVRSGS